MAEYIDREQLLELINEDCKYQNPTNEYTRGCNEVCDWAIKTIKNIPTADVVPKSEVEKWKEINEQLHKEMSERMIAECKIERKLVAREIFEEVMTEFKKYYSEYQEPKCKINKALHKANRLIMDTVWDILYELKKKYTESENG